MKINFGKHHGIALVVLIATLALFVPYLFHRQFQHFEFHHSVEVPVEPSIDIKPLDFTGAIPLVAKPTSGAVPVAGWVLEVRRYSRLAEGNLAVKKLQSAGLRAYLQKVPAAYELMVGPEASEAELMNLQMVLFRIMHTRGNPVMFDPFATLSP